MILSIEKIYELIDSKITKEMRNKNSPPFFMSSFRFFPKERLDNLKNFWFERYPELKEYLRTNKK